MKDALTPLARMMRIGLAVIVVSGLVTASGCSWFKRSRTPQAQPTPPVIAQPTPGPTATPTPAVPPSAPREGYRPGEVTPLPQMRVIYFDYDRSNLRPDQLPNLEHNLRFLRESPQIRVLIEGHCDERGSVEYNFALGERRARAVRDYFVQNGIPAERLSILSKGEEEPVDPGHNEAAWAKNRRCEFKQVH